MDVARAARGWATRPARARICARSCAGSRAAPTPATPNARSVTELALLLLIVEAGALAGGQAGAARVTVQSDTNCPTAAEVGARLQALLPPLAEGEAPAQASITAEDGALRVQLRGGDGAAL